MRSEDIGRILGNWNDRRSGHDSRSEASRLWRVLDRIAGWLYTRAEAHDGE
jgi:hypothetical protein